MTHSLEEEPVTTLEQAIETLIAVRVRVARLIREESSPPEVPRVEATFQRLLDEWTTVRPFLVIAPDTNAGVSASDREAIDRFIEVLDERDEDPR